MDDQLITEKLENLLKYLPFIDFILKIDKEKYFKFVDIRKWIASKKRYPLSDLQKIEQSLVTQYKNLLLVDHKIPKDIMAIFSGEINHQFVNLCSDDEEEHEKDNEKLKNKEEEDKNRSSSSKRTENEKENKKRKNKKEEKNRSSLKTHSERERKSSSNHKKDREKHLKKHRKRERKSSSSFEKDHKHSIKVDADDDDLEIVSIEYLPKAVSAENQQSNTITKSFESQSPKKELDLDDLSAELLRKIDVLNEDVNKNNNNFHEPINYHKNSDDDDDDKMKVVDNLFQRRQSDDLLFKRREDFKDLDDHKNQHKKHKKHKSSKCKRRISSKSNTTLETIETISLDSSFSSGSEDLVQSTSSAKVLAANKIKTQSTADNCNAANKEEELMEPSKLLNTVSINLGVDALSLDVNSKLNVTKQTESKENIDTIKNSLTSDRVIISAKATIDESTVTSINSNNSHNVDAVIDLLDMDIDTENDLNDVLNEIENSTETNIKTTNVECKTPPNLCNSLPPQGVAAKSVENNSNTPTSDVQINSSDCLHNLTPECILTIFEDIQSKSDFELDKILKTLATAFDEDKKHAPPQPNNVIPPAPHINPIILSPAQHTPVQQQSQHQQPTFYPNPIMPPQLPPPHHQPQQQYAPQQQHQSVPHHYNTNSNFIPVPRKGPLINLNDPRVLKQLHEIYNSTMWSELNRNRAANLISRSQQEYNFTTTTNYQQQPQNNPVFPPHHFSSSVPATTPSPIIDNRQKTVTKICYGDYKRRQREQQEQLKRKQEDEKKRKEAELNAKQAEEAKALEQREHLKQTNEIRSILFSTLEPYKDKISTIWEQHNKSTSAKKDEGSTNKATTTKEGKNTNTSNTNTTSSISQPAKKDEGTTKIENKPQAKTLQNNSTKTTEQVKNNAENSNKSLDGQKELNNKINRIHKILECTVKGFDQLEDYVPKTIGGRRRSSIHARSAILEQLSSDQPPIDYSEQSDINWSQHKSIGDKRRSSLFQSNDYSDSEVNSSQSLSGMPSLVAYKRRASCHSPIQEQLNCSDSSDTNSSQLNSAAACPKRRSSILARSAIEKQLRQQQNNTDNSDSEHKMSSQSTIDGQNSTFGSTIKRRKTIDEPIQATRRVKCFIIRDDESSVSGNTSSDNEGDFEKFRIVKQQRQKAAIIDNQPKVVLERISDDFIRKHSKRIAPAGVSSDILHVHLVESTKPNILEKPSPPVAKKVVKLKKLNNDCQMTQRNSRFCVLCTSKPSDLTNHYLRKHKTESYVSRLSFSKLEDLVFNTPFAKLQPGKFRSKYLVECPFCDLEIVEPFMELYDHYSFHTGEFAYQCGHCQLEKPYKSDITAHQKRSKTCRNCNVRVLYRYPPKSHCIYLYYCSICNFVQLNQANVIKHLQEHHNPRDAVEKNVYKCILAAISDAPEINDKQENEPIPEKNFLQPINGTPLNEVKKSELDFKVDDDYIPVNNEPGSEDIFEGGKLSLEELLQKMHEEPTTSSPPMTVIHCDTYSLNINENNIATVDTPRPLLPTADNEKRHLPMTIKVEAMQIDESPLIAPPLSLPSSATPNYLTEYAVVNELTTSDGYPQTGCIITSDRMVKVEDNILPIPLHTSSSAVVENSTSEILNNPSTSKEKPNVYSVYEKYHTYPTNVNYFGLYKCMADDCYYSTDSSDEILKHLNDHSQDCLPTEYLHCPYCTILENMQITVTQLIEHIRSDHQHMIYQCSICCYRSCEASNVAIHQQQIHADAINLQIFKCSGTEVNPIEKQSYINEKILENVRNITCPRCSHTNYNSNLLRQHITQYHNIPVGCLNVYSCIYCAYIDRVQDSIRKHVAIKHPEELPYVYDHNTFVLESKDTKSNLNILDLAETVVCIEVESTCDNVKEKLVQDVKPSLEELVNMNEDTVKIRLRKLTTHTGVAPDSLYRCPESNCGGFFSVYDLWLRHMKVRHRCLECQCPHCPPETEDNYNNHSLMRTLESYEVHFEEHRRHIYTCFHCAITMRNEDMAKQHAAEQHSNLGAMRFEQVRFNINYSYFIMIQSGLFNERVEFITEFLPILDKRLKDMESMEIQKLKHRWLLQDNAIWLENIPKFNFDNRKVLKKCVFSDCKFCSLHDELIFKHLNANHQPYSTNFNCKNCKMWVPIKNWNDISDHIKLHRSETIFICGACLHTNACRTKMAEHIREQHAARDVPVAELIRTGQQTKYIKLAVVFANNQLTFSTIRNCFCCSESRMNGDTFNLHLRRYHKLSLNYFCEWCGNTQFKCLDEVSEHFKNSHPRAHIKIRCELASNSDLIVISLNEFQIQIINEPQKMVMVNVKEEPNDQPTDDNNDDDDDVILLEDNDIVIQQSLKNQQLDRECENKPIIKCKAMNNLLQKPNTSTSLNSPILRVLPNIKITTQIGEVVTTTSNTMSTAATFPSSSHTTPTASNYQNVSNYQNNFPTTVNDQNYANNINSLPSSSKQAQTNTYTGPGVIHQTHVRPQYSNYHKSTATSNTKSNARPIPSLITQYNTRAHTPYNFNSQYKVMHGMSSNYNVNASVNNHYNVAPNSLNYNNINPNVNANYNLTPNVSYENYNVNPNVHQQNFHN